VALVAAGGSARADEQGDMDKVRASYLARQYDDVEARLKTLLDPNQGTLHDPAMITQARMYRGAALVARGKPGDAGAVFERLLLDDPQFEPDPLSFPTDVIDLFIDTRTRLRDRLNEEAQERARFEAQALAREAERKLREKERVATLERLAAEETVTQIHSRWIALVPFGAGQFQNGKTTLGWVFLSMDSALLLGTAITVPIYLYDLQQRTSAYQAQDPTAANSYIQRAQTVQTINLSLVGAFAVTAIAGILQGELEYVPTVVEHRSRSIPPLALDFAPTAGPPAEGRGAVFGLAGRF
jgi:hypothetical protein